MANLFFFSRSIFIYKEARVNTRLLIISCVTSLFRQVGQTIAERNNHEQNKSLSYGWSHLGIFIVWSIKSSLRGKWQVDYVYAVSKNATFILNNFFPFCSYTSHLGFLCYRAKIFTRKFTSQYYCYFFNTS